MSASATSLNQLATVSTANSTTSVNSEKDLKSTSNVSLKQSTSSSSLDGYFTPSASLTSITSNDSFYDASSDAAWSTNATPPGALALAAPAVESVYTPTSLAEDAIALRTFARDLVEASGTAGSPHDRAEAFRIALANHPEVLLWIIEEKDLLEIGTAAELPGLPLLDHPVLKAISDIHEAIQPILEAHKTFKSLKRSVKHGQKFYDTYSKEGLITAITTEVKTYTIKTLRYKTKSALKQLLRHILRQQAVKAYNLLTFDNRYDLLSLVPDIAFDKIAEQIDSAIVGTKISESDEVKMMMDPNQGFDLSTVPTAFREFFENVLTQYFDKLPLEDKRRIAVGLLELPPGSSDEEKLAAILNNAGPAMQKLFQLFGDDVKSEKLGKVMAALKNQIKPFPSDQAISIIENKLGGSITDLFGSFREKPIAAASVGQVHFASLKETGEDVIVKVMRPGLRERAAREIALLKELAPGVGTRKIVERLEESLLEELDFTLEAKNMVAGEVYWSSQKGIYPVGLIGDFIPTKDVLVMERAYTKPINEFHGADLPKKSEALGTFTEMWYDNAMFGNGFFHGDLHAGNIFLNPDANPSGVPYGQDFQLSLIDFGACGRLSNLEQRSIISLILGSETSTPNIMIDSLKDLCTMTPYQEETLLEYTIDILEQDIETSEGLSLMLNKAIELEVGLPKNLILYNRGRAFLENQIRDTNAELEKFDPQGRIPRQRPQTIFRNLMIWRLGEDLISRALMLKSSDEAKLDMNAIAEMIATHVPTIDEGEWDADEVNAAYWSGE